MANMKFTEGLQALYDALPTMKEARKAEKEAADAAFIQNLHANNVVDNSILFNKRNTLENLLEEGIDRFFGEDNVNFDGSLGAVELNRAGVKLVFRETHKGDIEVRYNSSTCVIEGDALDAQMLLDLFLPVQQ